MQPLVASNPVSATRRRDTGKRIPYLFDLNDAKRLLEVVGTLPDRSRAPHRGRTYETIFALLYGLGLRVGEAVRLKLGDVDFHRDTLFIRETKFSKSRIVPLGTKLAARLRGYIEERHGEAREADRPLFSFTKRGCIRPKRQLRDSLQRETLNSGAIKIARHANVYTCGDQDEIVYFIESGQIKLLMLSPEGKECLLAIYSAGDIFGELCLSGLGARLETATAMEETRLKQIPCSQFLARLNRDSVFDGFVRYMAGRVDDQQQVIANMVTGDSEQRLGETLLQTGAHMRQERAARRSRRTTDIA